MERPVTFKCGRERIVGILHLPERRRKKVPAVVFLHGFTGNKVESHRIFVKTARALTAAGFACLRFDFRGSGDSEGDFSTMTVSAEIKDARAALQYMRARPEVDPKRVAILGLSMGGLVGAMVLGSDPRIKCSVLWAPVSDLPELVRNKMTREAKRQLQLMGCADYGGFAVGKAFIDEADQFAPLKAVARAAGPVLFVHGDRDDSVPLRSTDAYADALARANKPFAKHIVSGADHTFSSLPWEMETMAVSLEWFRCNL